MWIPPWICPSAASGLSARPTSCADASFTTSILPVASSTSTSAACAAKPYVADTSLRAEMPGAHDLVVRTSAAWLVPDEHPAVAHVEALGRRLQLLGGQRQHI